MPGTERSKQYFDTQAGDFEAAYKDGRQIKDPVRRFLYRYFIRTDRRNIRLEAIIELAESRLGTLQGKRILDLGCGPGLYTLEYARRGASVTGVDFSPAMLDLARRNAETAKLGSLIEYRQADLASYEAAETYDLIIMSGLTEYLPKQGIPGLLTRLRGNMGGPMIVTFARQWTLFSLLRVLWLGSKGLRLALFSDREIDALLAGGFRRQGMRTIAGYRVVMFDRQPD